MTNTPKTFPASGRSGDHSEHAPVLLAEKRTFALIFVPTGRHDSPESHEYTGLFNRF